MQKQATGGTPARDISARWWRQVGFWGLTFNAILGFPAMAFLLVFGVEIGTLAGAYATILAAWTAAAGIRQWGKNRNAEEVEPTRPLDETPLVPPASFTERIEE